MLLWIKKMKWNEAEENDHTPEAFIGKLAACFAAAAAADFAAGVGAVESPISQIA